MHSAAIPVPSADPDGVGQQIAELDGATRRVPTLTELDHDARGEHARSPPGSGTTNARASSATSVRCDRPHADVHDRVVSGNVAGLDRRRGVESVGKALREVAEEPARDARRTIRDHQDDVEQEGGETRGVRRRCGHRVGRDALHPLRCGHRRVASVNIGHGTKPQTAECDPDAVLRTRRLRATVATAASGSPERAAPRVRSLAGWLRRRSP